MPGGAGQVEVGGRDHEPRDGLAGAKEATVLVIAEGGPWTAAASGVVLVREGERALVATADATVGRSPAAISVVVRAGTPGERRVDARLERRDARRGLAIVSIPAADAPAPLSLAPPLELREAQRLRAVGHRYPNLLSKELRIAAAAGQWGLISGLTLDADGVPVALHLDGVPDPGFAGAPVLTEDGHLAGVVISTQLGSSRVAVTTTRPLAALVARTEPEPGDAPGAVPVPAPAANRAPTPEELQREGLLPDDRVIRLPQPVVDAAIAYDGRRLVLQIEGRAGISIVDLDAGRVAAEVDLPSADFQLAAGGDVAIAAFPATDRLEVIDLATLERTARANPLPDPILAIAMGHARSDRMTALTCRDDPTREARRCRLWAFDPRGERAYEIIPRPAPETDASGRFLHVVEAQPGDACLRTDASAEHLALTVLGGWTNITLVGHEGADWTWRPMTIPAGNFAVTEEGLTFMLAVGVDALVPAVSGPYFLAIDGADGTLTVVHRGGSKDLENDQGRGGRAVVIPGIGRFPGPSDPARIPGFRDRLSADGTTILKARRANAPRFAGKTSFDLGRRVVFDPARGRVTFVTRSGYAVVIRQLDTKALRRPEEGSRSPGHR